MEKKQAYPDFSKEWEKYTSRWRRFFYFFWVVISYLFFLLLPIGLSYLVYRLYDEHPAFECDPFFSCSESVWGTSLAVFGFFLSILAIALTKEKTYFGKPFSHLFILSLKRYNHLEYQLIYWEVVLFIDSFLALIAQNRFELFVTSLGLGISSLVSLFLVYRRLRSSDEENWVRYLRETEYFHKTPFYIRQNLSFINQYTHKFHMTVSSFFSPINKLSSLRDSINYLSEQIDRKESIFPDFDLLIFSLSRLSDCIDTEMDFVSLRTLVFAPAFGLVNKMRENGFLSPAKELDKALCKLAESLLHNKLFSDAVGIACNRKPQESQSEKQNIEFDVFVLQARFMVILLIDALQDSKRSLFLFPGLPDQEMISDINQKIVLLKAQSDLLHDLLFADPNGERVFDVINKSISSPDLV